VARVTKATGVNPIKLVRRLSDAGHEAEIHTTTVLKAHGTGGSWHVEVKVTLYHPGWPRPRP
jgi:hypothetical protein